MSEPKDKWEEMVKESKDAIEDFNDFLVDKAIIWADAELSRLNAKISDLENVWQTIETAPKDGTSIILYPHYTVTHFDVELGGWAEWSDFHDEKHVSRTNFTHWMPIPNPPISSQCNR